MIRNLLVEITVYHQVGRVL